MLPFLLPESLVSQSVKQVSIGASVFESVHVRHVQPLRATMTIGKNLIKHTLKKEMTICQAQRHKAFLQGHDSG